MTITLQDIATILGLPIIGDEIPSLFDQPVEDLGLDHHVLSNVAKQPKSTKELDRHANDPTLRKSLQIKSTTLVMTHFFIEVIFDILDNVGALWNPPIVDHVVLD
ncbi:hypothetical protein HKD37_08G021951 [Glycine soja]